MGLQMKTITAAALLVMFLTANANLMAQVPGLQDLTQRFDQAAGALAQAPETSTGFKKIQMPKLLDGLMDVRLKKPTLPKIAWLEKLKNFGKPQLDSGQATTGPLLAGLSKLLPQKEASAPSLLDRMLGKTAPTSPMNLLEQNQFSDLAQATKGLQEQVGRMSQGVKSSATELLGNQGSAGSLQPPLRSARQYSAGQSQLRY